MRESWIRFVGVVALLLCVLLLFVPLYFVVVSHGQSHWSTLFDLPSDLLIAGPSESRLAVYLVRGISFLLVAGTMAPCVFRQFAFRWLPPLTLCLLAAAFPVRWLYPKLGNPPGVVHPLGFALLVAFVFCCALVATLSSDIRPRAIVGFIVAPLMTPLFFAIVVAAEHGFGEAVSGLPAALLLYGVFAYAATLILGIPGFMLVRKLHRGGGLSAVGVGALTGLVMSLAVGRMFGTWSVVNPWDLLWCTLAGALSAWVFWLIVRPDWRTHAYEFSSANG